MYNYTLSISNYDSSADSTFFLFVGEVMKRSLNKLNSYALCNRIYV